MTSTRLKFEDFQEEKLTKKEQKTVRGGNADVENKDPNKGGNGGTGTP